MDDLQQVGLVTECRVDRLKLPLPLGEQLVRPVDQDLGDGRIAHQLAEWTEPENLVHDPVDQRHLVLVVQGHRLLVGQIVRQPDELSPQVALRPNPNPVRADRHEQLLEELVVEGSVPDAVRGRRRRGRARGRRRRGRPARRDAVARNRSGEAVSNVVRAKRCHGPAQLRSCLPYH